MIELNGRRLGLDTDLARDYEAFHDAAATVDLTNRGRMLFSGKGARAALNGVLTCDVEALGPGSGARTGNKQGTVMEWEYLLFTARKRS